MAQADSVPTAIRAPITGATSKTSTSGAQITQGDPTLRPLWWEKRRDVDLEDLSGNLGADLNRRWYERITGRMPAGWYIVAVCYATVVILLGWPPWNALLILLLFSNSKRLRFDAFDTMPSGRLGSSQ